ncbi:hypothetical protein COCCADRAFT_101060 [Bipolaris zeicola 26-R-13]|uniref:Uncharacterized protein n=1 Tax=Cochliobolus carbonum (strain 26-R-13) TaxID=930089 RepID=W6YJN1_COCC2|nr:uncharacterized protein COCCADRAFT_101060 [Bipolaris zeicola 26-R-13]EUC31511.1 hypothetical protein COCCADRAFT_101060 [Bipolaris zeicola 26-R-13]
MLPPFGPRMQRRHCGSQPCRFAAGALGTARGVISLVISNILESIPRSSSKSFCAGVAGWMKKQISNKKGKKKRA